MSNITLIKLLAMIRMLLWYCSLFICCLTQTLFILQTWSTTLTIIFILNFIYSLTTLFLSYIREYYRKVARYLFVLLPLFSIVTVIVYALHMNDVYYRAMNLVTLNIMQNDRYRSLLSTTLNHYKCCRIQEEILFDSVNEREYFLAFPHCETTIVQNERKRDHWDHITTCGAIFRSVILYHRLVLLLDLLLHLLIVVFSLKWIWQETDERDNDRPLIQVIGESVNFKMK
jgi:hypothetical protein